MIRRRWFQFSLRSFLIVVTVFAVWLGWKVDRARKQREAVRAIETIRGVVQYDWQDGINSWETSSTVRFVPSNGEPLAPAWLRNVMGEHLFQNVTGVVFRTRQAEYYETAESLGIGYSMSRTTNVFGGYDPKTSQIEEVIPRLRDLPRLRAIHLEGDSTAISKAVEKELRASFPQSQVIREYVHTAIKTAPPPPRPRRGRGLTPPAAFP